ncbi:hypothetical protein LTR28_001037, partial [Elasticomyces elasticus]
MVFRDDERGGFEWSGRKSTVDGMGLRRKPPPDDIGGSTDSARRKDGRDPAEANQTGPHEDDESVTGKSVFKRATGRMNDAKSGLGRSIKDVVGLRGHHQKSSRDSDDINTAEDPSGSNKNSQFRRPQTTSASTPTSPKSADGSLDASLLARQNRDSSHSLTERVNPIYAKHLSETPKDVQASFFPHVVKPSSRDHQPEVVGSLHQSEKTIDDEDGAEAAKQARDEGIDPPSNTGTAEPSIADSTYRGVDLDDILPAQDPVEEISPLLRHTQSFSNFQTSALQHRADEYYPRHLSFSTASDSILTWAPIPSGSAIPPSHPLSDPKRSLAKEKLAASDARHLRARLAETAATANAFTQSQISAVAALLSRAGRDSQVLSALYHPHLAS